MLSNQTLELTPLYLDDGPDVEALGIDCDQAVGDFVVFFSAQKVMVLRAGGLCTETVGGGTSQAVFKFDLRPTAGSDSNRGDGDIGEIDCADLAAGSLIYDEEAAGEIIEPGEEVVFEMTTRSDGTSSAGHIRPFLLVSVVPEEPGNLSGMVETD